MTREEAINNTATNYGYAVAGGCIERGYIQDAFERGAEWADAHPKNPWHKASEELPTHFGDYLVVIKSRQFGRRCAFKCWYGYPEDPFGDNPSKEWVLEDDEIVTHWMEIPELPKEEEK